MEEDISLVESLQFAEKSWRDASQANFLLEKKLNDVTEKYEAKIKQLEAELEQRKKDTEIWRNAYETIIHSKTWKTAGRIKKLFGKKQG